jgi:hypothetical protein
MTNMLVVGNVEGSGLVSTGSNDFQQFSVRMDLCCRFGHALCARRDFVDRLSLHGKSGQEGSYGRRLGLSTHNFAHIGQCFVLAQVFVCD